MDYLNINNPDHQHEHDHECLECGQPSDAEFCCGTCFEAYMRWYCFVRLYPDKTIKKVRLYPYDKYIIFFLCLVMFSWKAVLFI